MDPVSFPEVNTNFGPPEDYTEEQVRTVPAYVGNIVGGPFDGGIKVIVAWKPSEADLIRLNAGEHVYLMVIGSLPPHLLSTEINQILP